MEMDSCCMHRSVGVGLEGEGWSCGRMVASKSTGCKDGDGPVVCAQQCGCGGGEGRAEAHE
eukprot:scaffold319552_cov12-Tisochrysis_lutea.AAC.1